MGGGGSTSGEPVVLLHAPGSEKMAAAICDALGPGACSSAVYSQSKPDSGATPADAALCWERFPSDDPNIKLRISELRDRHVVLLFDMFDRHAESELLSLLLFVQGFRVPRPLEAHARAKWKRTEAEGEYDVCSASKVTVLVPWYRYGSMERTCRWAWREGGWDNGVADGEYVDVPTATTFLALLSCAPACLPPRGRVPKQIVFVDLHEYAPVEATLRAGGGWVNRPTAYDLESGSGTYFTSAIDVFLRTQYRPALADASLGFVVFPDAGAHRRFAAMVARHGLPPSNVLWIEKTRVGTAITQSAELRYIDGSGEATMGGKFPDGARIMIIDDFTNSGSTLFGCAAILRSRIGSATTVGAFVSHLVAGYRREKVRAIVDQLYAEDCPLDTLVTTDSNATVATWLEEELANRPAPPKASLMPIAPLLATWLRASALASDAKL